MQSKTVWFQYRCITKFKFLNSFLESPFDFVKLYHLEYDVQEIQFVLTTSGDPCQIERWDNLSIFRKTNLGNDYTLPKEPRFYCPCCFSIIGTGYIQSDVIFKESQDLPFCVSKEWIIDVLLDKWSWLMSS